MRIMKECSRHNFSVSTKISKVSFEIKKKRVKLVNISNVCRRLSVLGISVDAITAMFKFSVKWDYVFEYRMDQSKSFAAVAEGIYNEIVDRTKVTEPDVIISATTTSGHQFKIYKRFNSCSV